jgi:hypothetical protein
VNCQHQVRCSGPTEHHFKSIAFGEARDIFSARDFRPGTADEEVVEDDVKAEVAARLDLQEASGPPAASRQRKLDRDLDSLKSEQGRYNEAARKAAAKIAKHLGISAADILEPESVKQARRGMPGEQSNRVLGLKVGRMTAESMRVELMHSAGDDLTHERDRILHRLSIVPQREWKGPLG